MGSVRPRSARLRRLAAANLPSAREFPDYPPYGGAFSEVIPHLTIAEGAPLAEIAVAEEAVTPGLPLRCSAGEAWLMAGRAEQGSWAVVERFALGA